MPISRKHVHALLSLENAEQEALSFLSYWCGANVEMFTQIIAQGRFKLTE